MLQNAEKYFSDVELLVVTNGNTKPVSLRAHRCILSARSPFFNEKLKQKSAVSENMESTSSIQVKKLESSNNVLEIKGFSVETVKAALEFIYSGIISSKEVDTKELMKLSRLLGLRYLYNYLVFISRQLAQKCDSYLQDNTINLTDFLTETQEQLASDISSLFNTKESSDIRITIAADKTSLTHCHKCILAARSEFFRAMLFSGLQESRIKEALITLEDIHNKATLDVVLKYLYGYSPEELLSGGNCLEVHFACKMLNISELEIECRQLAASLLDVENVCDVLNVAHIFSDLKLKRECITFIRENYDTVKKISNNFQKITDAKLIAELKIDE